MRQQIHRWGHFLHNAFFQEQKFYQGEEGWTLACALTAPLSDGIIMVVMGAGCYNNNDTCEST